MARTDVTATPVEVVLQGEDGEVVLKMHPLRDRDLGELDEFVQSRLIANVRRSMPREVDKATWKAVMSLAMTESLGLTHDRHPGVNVFTTAAGLARLAWQGMRRAHPDLTTDRLEELLRRDPRNVDEFNLAFKRVNAMPVSPPGGGDAGAGPTTPTPTTPS